MALTTAAEFGTILVLNVAKGTIREADAEDLTMDDPEPYSRSSRVRDAMEVVEEYLGKLRKLEWVPVGEEDEECVLSDAHQVSLVTVC